MELLNMSMQTYDEIIQLVVEELHKTRTISFATFRRLDRKLGLPNGTALEASGWKDILEFHMRSS